MINKFLKLCLFIFISLIAVSPLFIKVKVQCRSQFGECPPELNTKLRMLNGEQNMQPSGKSLFLTKNKVGKILKNDFLISDFSMQIKLPNTLLVNTLVKKPKYAIYDKSKSLYWLIDANGLVLSSSGQSTLPILYVDTISLNGGQTINEDKLFALKIIEGIFQMYQISTGTIQNDTLVVDLPLGIRVIFPLGDADRDLLLGSLRLIYTKVTTTYAGQYSQIDLRFKNPILR